MNNSLYLFQSYQDAWDDYKRSLVSPSFPVWDYIILTASNAHQAESFQMQIENRCDFLPSRTVFAVIPDEGGVRVGSGGATLSALKYLSEQGGWEGKRVLVIHSGGDSKRVPQYSALGKLFSPVPHILPDVRGTSSRYSHIPPNTRPASDKLRSPWRWTGPRSAFQQPLKPLFLSYS